MDTDKLKAALRTRKGPTVPPEEFVSFGSTLLNLAVTGKAKNGLQKGAYCLLVGGSNSGKTWLALSVMAEACYDDKFSDYQMVYNGPEDGAKMDLKRCFGRLADRLTVLTPGAGASSSPEEFYDHLDDTITAGPCVYVLDSMDALMPKDDEEQLAKERKAREAGKDAGGTYGTAKAKINSQRLRTANQRIVETGSILIIISQTRDNFGFGSQFNPETRSGGKALAFYAQTQIWLKKKQGIDRTFKGKAVQVGGWTQARVKRTRFTGQEWDIDFPIYYSAGLDDTESCVRWLVEWSHWKGDKTKVAAPEFDFDGKIEDLCRAVSADPKLGARLRKVTAAHWAVVAEHTKVERRSKYGD